MHQLLLLSSFITLALSFPAQFVFVNETMTWPDAQRYCREKYTDLATIENDQQTVQLLDSVNDDSSDLAWIGLYDDLNSWKWTLEDTDFFNAGEKDFRSWNKPEEYNYGGRSLCVYMYLPYGIWFTTDCSNALPSFLCYDGRQNANASYVWVEQNSNWTEAQRYCREHHTDLVSIRNETENMKITLYLNYYTAIWIGLYKTRSWSDQSNSSFTNWRSGQPDNAAESQFCTAVSFSDSGQWTVENCKTELPFICYNASFLISSRQYHFVSESKTWTEAQRFCRQNYTDLATIDNMEDMNRLIDTVNGSFNGSAWIGLYDDVNSWRWSLEDNDFYQEGERDFRNFYHEPFNTGGNEMCVIMSFGLWYDLTCSYPKTFVCYDGRENASQKYIFVSETKSWAEALRYCREMYTDLANVRNEMENQQISSITYGNDVWIGLYRNRLWSDQSSSSFTNWLTEGDAPQPDNGLYAPEEFGAQHCTAASLKHFGKWTDERCFATLPFFCYGDYKVGLKVKLRSVGSLSKSQIEDLVIIQLQEEFIRRGLPSNFTMNVRNYHQTSP